MAGKQRRATLIHNDRAGDKRHSRAVLTELLQRAGYEASYFPAKQCDLGEVLGHPAEIIVAAGSDGTVARVVAQARSDGPPIAILPLGTANNIANSLGIGGPVEYLVAGWPDARARPYYPISVSGPWGVQRLAEGIGFGAFEQAMSELPKRLRVARARELIRKIVIEAPPEILEIGIDDESIAGRFAVLEITSIPLIGPRLRLAPEADPSDRDLDICFVGDNDAERQDFARWLSAPENTKTVPVSLRRAQRLTIAGQFRRVRLDSRLWEGEPDPRTANAWPVIGIATEPSRCISSCRPDPFAVAAAPRLPDSRGQRRRRRYDERRRYRFCLGRGPSGSLSQENIVAGRSGGDAVRPHRRVAAEAQCFCFHRS